MEEGKKKRKMMPEYLRAKNQLIGTVTFAALFSIVFLLVSIPFSHNAWFQLGNSVFFLFTVLFAVTSLLIVIASKVVMYKTRGILPLTMAGYVAWNVCEVIFICLLYTILTISITSQGWGAFIPIFFNSLVYGTISLAIPYIIAGMYCSIEDKKSTIRMMNYGSVVTDEVLPPGGDKKINLYDNGGAMKLSVRSSSLLYMEADDNYIKVWYEDSGGDLRVYMLRCPLKTVEESFLGSSLMRCHRKYIVNLDKVKVLRRGRDGYELYLGNDSIDPIPVTKTYESNVLAYFNREK